MQSSRPENLSSDRRSATEELIRGRESAQQLRQLLRDLAHHVTVTDGTVSSSTEDLVLKILNSFTNTLSMFNANNDSDEVSQVPVNSVSSCDGRKSTEDSGETSKSSTVKDRRGCYKRRKTSHSWIRETSALIDDGQAWRKYGQKLILNAKYPRNYYRCTHKYDRNCQATKQFQKIEEDPPKYHTTYFGHHTCMSFLKAPEIILDSTPPDSNSILLSFNTCNRSNITSNNIQYHHDRSPAFNFSSSFPRPITNLVKQEFKEKMSSPVGDRYLAHNLNYSSSSRRHDEYDDHDLLYPDHHLSGFESNGVHMQPVLTSVESDLGDAISEVMAAGSIAFADDVFHFDF